MKRKLQRKSGSRKALLKNLTSSLILHEKITTTVPKAKELKAYAERLISRGKKGDLCARRYISRFLPKNVVAKIMEDIAPSFSQRNGGYIKIVRIAERKGDNAPLCIVFFSEREKIKIENKAKKANKIDEKTKRKSKP